MLFRSLVQLQQAGLTDRGQIDENLGYLLEAYKSEGITPTDNQILQGLIDMSRHS